MESDRQDPEVRIKKLETHNEYLRGRLRGAEIAKDNSLKEVKRWKSIAEREHRSWIRTHDAMNLLRQDAMELMEQRDVFSIYRKLAAVREERDQLLAKRQQWRGLARRATVAKVTEAQRARDLEEVVEQLREKLTEVEQDRDETARQAEGVIDQRDQQLARFKGWCERWLKGEVGAIDVVAGITAELDGNFMVEPSVLDRHRAVEHAKTVSLMNEASDQLAKIEALLDAEGVMLVNTHAKQVKDYIDLMKGRVAAAEEGEGDN